MRWQSPFRSVSKILSGARRTEEARLSRILSAVPTYYPNAATWHRIEGWLATIKKAGRLVWDWRSIDCRYGCGKSCGSMVAGWRFRADGKTQADRALPT